MGDYLVIWRLGAGFSGSTHAGRGRQCREVLAGAQKNVTEKSIISPMARRGDTKERRGSQSGNQPRNREDNQRELENVASGLDKREKT